MHVCALSEVHVGVVNGSRACLEGETSDRLVSWIQKKILCHVHCGCCWDYGSFTVKGSP